MRKFVIEMKKDVKSRKLRTSGAHFDGRTKSPHMYDDIVLSSSYTSANCRCLFQSKVDKTWLDDLCNSPSFCPSGTSKKYDAASPFLQATIIILAHLSYIFLKKIDALFLYRAVYMSCSVVILNELGMEYDEKSICRESRNEHNSAQMAEYKACKRLPLYHAGYNFLDWLASSLFSRAGIHDVSSIPMGFRGVTVNTLFESVKSTVARENKLKPERDRSLANLIFNWHQKKAEPSGQG